MDDDGPSNKYRLFLGLLGLMGLVAVGFASYGLFSVFTADPGNGETASVPAEFQCEAFHGAPEVGHEAPGGIGQNATVAAMHSIDATTTGDGFEAQFNVSDPAVLEASARQQDNTDVSVEIQNTTVVVTHDERTPVRVWIDSAEDGLITRSELDICPPEAG